MFAFPAGYLIVRAITHEADVLGTLFSDRTLPPLWRTLRLATVVSLTAGVIGTTLAWLVTRTDLPFRRTWTVLTTLPLVYPTFIGTAALQTTLNPGGLLNDVLGNLGVDRTPEVRGFTGAWLVLTLFTYPYVMLPVAARLRGLPATLEESARLLGDSGWSTFRRIVLPQTTSAITAGMVLVFLYSISDFGAVQLVQYDTLTRAIWTNRLANQAVAFSLALVLLAIAMAVVVSERALTRRLPASTLGKSRTPVIHPLRRWTVPALGFMGLVITVGLIVPGAALVDWAIDGLRFSDGGFGVHFDELIEPTRNTTLTSVAAAVMAVLMVLPIAYLVARYRSYLGAGARAIVIANFAVPGLLVALALWFWTLQWGWAADHLANTTGLLILAYVIRFAAQAMGVSVIAVSSIPRRLDDAARTLGAGRVRRLLTVDLPLALPGLIAGGGLVLLSTMKELPITLLVAPFEFPTLTTEIFQSFEEAFIAESGLMALILVVLSGLLTWLLVIRRAERLD